MLISYSSFFIPPPNLDTKYTKEDSGKRTLFFEENTPPMNFGNVYLQLGIRLSEKTLKLLTTPRLTR